MMMKLLRRPRFHALLLAWAVLSAHLPSAGAQTTERNVVPWQPMPLLPAEAAKAGVFPGGEGGQWPRGPVVISPADPDFMLLPVDVGGLYRTLDGGRHWRVAMHGWNARGANGFAMDPRDARRVVGLGGNSLDWNPGWGRSPHGLYLSTDQGATWRQTLPLPDGLAGHVAFDPASFDPAKGHCTRAYAALPRSGLFRSEDGGETWQGPVSRLPVEEALDPNVAALFAVHPTTGTLFLGGKHGLFRSDDRGATFARVDDDDDGGGAVWGLSLSPAAPERVWISGTAGLRRSDDGGRTFAPLPARGIARDVGENEPIRQVTVSPVRPDAMFAWVQGENWQWVRYVSEDGGQSFTPVKIEQGLAARDGGHGPNAAPGGLAVLPLNVRQGHFAWHPRDPAVAFGLGGDWVTRSGDGGKTFAWWNNGNNGIMVGGHFNFSVHEPDTVFLAFQDYNGAWTRDGGKTWTYGDVSGRGWGGMGYGGHAVDGTTMWYGDAEGWTSPRRTWISRDGGRTWNFAKGATGGDCVWTGPQVSCSDPRDRRVLFASNWRSADGGATWAKMVGCEGVYLATPDGRRLLGRADGEILVVSDDSGKTWQTVARVPGGFHDVAYDPTRDRYYVASEERLKRWEAGTWTTLETPRDQYGSGRVSAVAVDPAAPEIVYAGGPKDVYTSHATVVRSTDAGRTWTNLTTGDGPHEVAAIRVHPRTREVWVNGGCFGMWRLAAPSTSESAR